MLIVAGCVLVAIWLLAVLMFKITKGIIHLVLLVAIVAIVMHFLRTR